MFVVTDDEAEGDGKEKGGEMAAIDIEAHNAKAMKKIREDTCLLIEQKWKRQLLHTNSEELRYIFNSL